jgi:hypothetical protein
VRAGFLVLVTDELEELGVGEQPGVRCRRPRARVVRRVGDRQLDLELTEARAAEPFDDRQLVARRKAAMVEPLLAVQAGRFDDACRSERF